MWLLTSVAFILKTKKKKLSSRLNINVSLVYPLLYCIIVLCCCFHIRNYEFCDKKNHKVLWSLILPTPHFFSRTGLLVPGVFSFRNVALFPSAKYTCIILMFLLVFPKLFKCTFWEKKNPKSFLSLRFHIILLMLFITH